MSRLGGRGRFSIRPGGTIYEPPHDGDECYPISLISRPLRPLQLPVEQRDIPLSRSYPYPPSSGTQPFNYLQPPAGRRDHRQSMKFTPWILHLTSESHKCADRNLFQKPKPRPPPGAGSRAGGARRPGTVAGQALPTQSRQNPQRRGTVVLPILPGPKRRFPFFDVSVMTLSNVLYTPGTKYSELSWKLLQQQGFTRHALHVDHTHNITNRGDRANAPQYPDGAHRLRIGRGLLTIEEDPPPRNRNYQGLQRFASPQHRERDQCAMLEKENSVIRHPALPNIDLLWCNYDHFMRPGVIGVDFTAVAMVDVAAWSFGVEERIVGGSSRWAGNDDSGGRVSMGWVARYGGRAPDAEFEEGDVEGLFRKIVQGGLFAGQDVVRQMPGLTVEGSGG